MGRKCCNWFVLNCLPVGIAELGIGRTYWNWYRSCNWDFAWILQIAMNDTCHEQSLKYFSCSHFVVPRVDRGVLSPKSIRSHTQIAVYDTRHLTGHERSFQHLNVMLPHSLWQMSSNATRFACCNTSDPENSSHKRLHVETATDDARHPAIIDFSSYGKLPETQNSMWHMVLKMPRNSLKAPRRHKTESRITKIETVREKSRSSLQSHTATRNHSTNSQEAEKKRLFLFYQCKSIVRMPFLKTKHLSSRISPENRDHVIHSFPRNSMPCVVSEGIPWAHFESPFFRYRTR